MDYLDNSIDEFTKKLASAAPVPGGGGASALVGAIGIALGDMVGELTVGKKKYALVEEDIKSLMKQAQTLRESLLECIEEDARAFEPLSKAYAVPKDDPGRDELMEECLCQAAKAPLQILRLCGEAVGLLDAFGRKGSRLVLSDAATGAMLVHGAMYGAAINVKVNTRLMKNREKAAELEGEADQLLASYLPMAEGIYENVLRGMTNGRTS